jgi:two-component system CheB/CheR fusion protein
VINNNWKIYKNIEKKQAVNFEGFFLPQMAGVKGNQPGVSPAVPSKNLNHIMEEAVNETLVRDLEYLGICIDANNSVIKTYGDTTKFLLQKNFNSNLADLLPRPLAVAFNSLCIQSKKSNEKTSLHGIKIKQGETSVKVNIAVSPLKIPKVDQSLFLFTFS